MENFLSVRLARLRAALDHAGLDFALISRPQHFFYLSGQRPSKDPILLLVGPQAAQAVAPFDVPGYETFPYTSYDIHQGWSIPENAAAAFNVLLASLPPARRVGLESGFLPVIFLPALQRKAGELVDLAGLLWQLRKIRDASEIARIETNVAANDRIFAAVRAQIHPGLLDFELWALVYRMLCEAGGEPVTMEADLVVGEGDNPAGKANGSVVREGSAVLLDIYTATRGYYADTTRVFVAGSPTPRQRAVHAVLVEAIAAGQEQLRPGVRACDVDRAVRGVIEHAGYGPNFPHHSGHAYNFFQQDKPYFIPAETSPLEAGMVVTLEPGIYLPGWGGMRLERNYLVGEAGPRTLDRFPLELPG